MERATENTAGPNGSPEKVQDDRARTFQEFPPWIQDAGLEIMNTLAKKSTLG